MADVEVKENINRFLLELYVLTQGDPATMVSMYDIGETLGLDRGISMRTAEELIGTGLAVIKTLNGGIGITTDGVTEAHQLGATADNGSPTGISLGDAPVMDETQCRAVERIAAELKSQLGEKGLNFDQLAEMMADLKSIDAQLSSPNPKNAIIRECFQSIKNVLKETGDSYGLSMVAALLGE
ncbi:MAG: hypothetical protein JSW04_11565 [Desulfobacterales bacterium]|nr:MAG: hypothetical protein JSW04_11565 [Desulfobacterales bacterium]